MKNTISEYLADELRHIDKVSIRYMSELSGSTVYETRRQVIKYLKRLNSKEVLQECSACNEYQQSKTAASCPEHEINNK